MHESNDSNGGNRQGMIRPASSGSSSWWSQLSFSSVLCVASGLSAASILSLGSLGSILSIGSAGSILSIGSAGSILSIGSAGARFNRRRNH